MQSNGKKKSDEEDGKKGEKDEEEEEDGKESFKNFSNNCHLKLNDLLISDKKELILEIGRTWIGILKLVRKK